MPTIQAPTFAGTALCTTSQRQIDGPIGVRANIEQIPGVNGQFAQPGGHGGRDIIITGILATTAEATRADALNTAYTELRAKEALADGATVGTFTDCSAASISNCLLMSYMPTGNVTIVPDSTNFKGIIPIRAIIRELSP